MPSSVIRYYRYDPAKQRLELVFQSGRRYSYHDVPAETFLALRVAASKGRYFNALIRDRFRHTREN